MTRYFAASSQRVSSVSPPPAIVPLCQVNGQAVATKSLKLAQGSAVPEAAGAGPGLGRSAAGSARATQATAILGSLVMGGEAYISFWPDLIDSDGTISNEDTREFLERYIAQFLSLISTLLPTVQ